MSSEEQPVAREIQRTAGHIIGAESRKLRDDGTICIPDDILDGLEIDKSEEIYPTVIGFSNGSVTVQFDLEKQ